jgi:hypothetical protein
MRFSHGSSSKGAPAFTVLLALAALHAAIPSGAPAEPKKATILHSQMVLPFQEKGAYEACLFPLERGRRP